MAAETYFVLEATYPSKMGTTTYSERVLVSKDVYEDECYEPADYFKGPCIEAKRIGELQLVGDSNLMDGIYRPDD